MSVTLNGHVYDASQFYGYGYLGLNADTGLVQFPNSIFTDMLAELAAASAILSGGISPSTSGNIIVSNGTLWTRSRDGTVDVVLGGHLLALNDNAKDIGSVAANRFRDLNLSRNIVAGGTVQAAGSVFSGDEFRFTAKTRMVSPSDGVLSLVNNAGSANASLTVGKVVAGVNNSTGYRLTQSTGSEASFAIMTSGNIFLVDESQFGVKFGGAVGINATPGAAGSLTAAGEFITATQLRFSANTSLTAAGTIGRQPSTGLTIWPTTGSSFDYQIYNVAGTVAALTMATGTTDFAMATNLTIGATNTGTSGPRLIIDGSNVVSGRKYAIISTHSADVVGTGSLEFLSITDGQIAMYTSAGETGVRGNLLAVVDNTYDIGASGSTRFRNLYLSASISYSGQLLYSSGASQAAFNIVRTSTNDASVDWYSAATCDWRLGQFPTALSTSSDLILYNQVQAQTAIRISRLAGSAVTLLNLDVSQTTTVGGTQLQSSSVGAGGVLVGAPTGSYKGTGTINVAADIYKNNTAYTNPDYVFEAIFTGDVRRFIDNPGAKEFRAAFIERGGRVMSIDEVWAYAAEHHHLPGFHDAFGAFERLDIVLQHVELTTAHVHDLHKRVERLEQQMAA